MKDIENSCKIALVQAEPVMFNKSASLKKALQWIAEAAACKMEHDVVGHYARNHK